jgi:hypothetical protein
LRVEHRIELANFVSAVFVVGFSSVLIIFLSHTAGSFAFYAFNGPGVTYYLMVTPVFLIGFPVSLFLSLRLRNKGHPLAWVGILSAMGLAFVLMMPVMSKSYYDSCSLTYGTDWMSLAFVVSGWDFTCSRPPVSSIRRHTDQAR